MGRRAAIESPIDPALSESSAATRSGRDPSKLAKQWTVLLVCILAIALLVTLGGVLRGALASSGPVVLPTPSGVPTVYVTDPPPQGPANDPGDVAPVEPAPASTVVPSGAVAPNLAPAYGTLALDLLARIPVQAAVQPSGYARSNFGPSWLDLGTGCDSRNGTLKRDLGKVAFAQGSAACVVQNGELKDPYSGGRLLFDRATASMIQIDEVVSLANAWQTGAQALSVAQRIAFANDALNLLAVDAVASMQKHSADAAGWLPPNAEFRCSYVARQISVKATYGLWMTPSEHDAIAVVLAQCPTTAAPTTRAPVENLPAAPVPDLDTARNSSTPASPTVPVQPGAGKDSATQDKSAQGKPDRATRIPEPQLPAAPRPPWHPPIMPPGTFPWPPTGFPVPPQLPVPPQFPVPPFGPLGLPPGAWDEGPIHWSQWPVDPPATLLPGIDGAPVPSSPPPGSPLPGGNFEQPQPQLPTAVPGTAPITAPATPGPTVPAAPPATPQSKVPVTLPSQAPESGIAHGTGGQEAAGSLPASADSSHWGLPALPTMLGR